MPVGWKGWVMGKYDALGTFLRRWAVRNDGPEVVFTFAQIVGLIGAPLPKAAVHMAWWCDPSSRASSRTISATAARCGAPPAPPQVPITIGIQIGRASCRERVCR